MLFHLLLKDVSRAPILIDVRLEEKPHWPKRLHTSDAEVWTINRNGQIALDGAYIPSATLEPKPCSQYNNAISGRPKSLGWSSICPSCFGPEARCSTCKSLLHADAAINSRDRRCPDCRFDNA